MSEINYILSKTWGDIVGGLFVAIGFFAFQSLIYIL